MPRRDQLPDVKNAPRGVQKMQRKRLMRQDGGSDDEKTPRNGFIKTRRQRSDVGVTSTCPWLRDAAVKRGLSE